MKYLKISTLDKGWQETDEMMLHAVMQLLVDYVEKQMPDQIVDWTSDDQHIHAWDVIKDTYDWWVNRRPARVDPLQNIELPDDYMMFSEPDERGNSLVLWGDYPETRQALLDAGRLEQERYEEDTSFLLDVIKIRHMLWT